MQRWIRRLIHLAPLILPLLGVLLGLIGYGISHYIPSEYELAIWTVITSVLIINGVLVGKTIRALALQTTLDPLTGLGNKGLFYYRLKREIQKSLKGTKGCFSLAMIDIDNFKSLNDTYGHLAGDNVLKQLAHLFDQNVRSSDVVVRWGGEEFAIILLDTEYEGALVFLERIREIIESHDFGKEVRSQKVTISVGVVSSEEIKRMVDEEDEAVNDVVRYADEALYQAKGTKNCVRGYAQSLQSDQI